RHELSGLRTTDAHQGDRARWPARRQCKNGLVPRMHGLFVREVLKRQRDSIRGLCRSYCCSAAGRSKNAAIAGEAPSPRYPDPNKEYKIQYLKWLTNR